MATRDVSVLNEIAKLRGFKGRKKVEKIGDKIIIKDISPIAEYAEYHAKLLKFEGVKKGEKIDGKIAEKEITPFEEFSRYVEKRTGKRPENIYMMLIPEEEFTEGLKTLEQKWLSLHQKFIEFCYEFAKGVKEYFEKNKTNVALITMENMFNVMEEYHRTHPGSMNIYSRDELIIGLGYCLPEKDIKPITIANKRAIRFEAIIPEK